MHSVIIGSNNVKSQLCSTGAALLISKDTNGFYPLITLIAELNFKNVF